MGKNYRILIGTHEIGRQVYDYASGFRALGYNADTFIFSKNQFYSDLAYDYYTKDVARSKLLLDNDSEVSVFYARQSFDCFLSDYDVYIFLFGSSLLIGNLDYPLLKKKGKKIIAVFNGDDIRHWSATKPLFEQLNLELPNFYSDSTGPYPPKASIRNASAHILAMMIEGSAANRLSNKLHTLRMAERYADVIFTTPSAAGLSIRPYMHYYNSLDLSLYNFNVPQREIPVVVHAPSDRGIKGTEQILYSLAQLQLEGVSFELRLLEKAPNQEIIRQLEDADIVIDQLFLPNGGFLSREAMASGCAVATRYHPDFSPSSVHPPLWDIGSSNIRERLLELIINKDLRTKLAEQGREFVSKYHDHRLIAQSLINSLEKNQDSEYDYYPTFFTRNYKLPEGEFIPSYIKEITKETIQHLGLNDEIRNSLIERELCI
jgi:hypothetical protein